MTSATPENHEPAETGDAGPEPGETPDSGPGLRASLEAILLVADEPVPLVVLAQVLERPRNEVEAELRDLAASYVAEGRGFDLREVAAAGGSTPARIARRWSSVSSVTGRRSG